MRYAIVIEKAENNYAAYVPDLPGCVATGFTVEETEQQIREAIDLHLRGMREDGLPIPKNRVAVSTMSRSRLDLYFSTARIPTTIK
jgi:predicted RNase H-like HicB family nuclease